MKPILFLVLMAMPPVGATAAAADAPWIVSGELIEVDVAGRHGVCRHEGTNARVQFEIADDELLDRLGGPGPAPDYAPGDRLIFHLERLGESARFCVSAVKEEIVELAGRDECLHVELIETARWPRLKCTRAKRDKSETFEADYFLEIAPETRFWKAGKQAKLEDVQVGDAVLAKTRGLGHGRFRVAVDVYLDQESWNRAQRP